MSSPSNSEQEKPKQRCCLGVLYYSHALQASGRKPVCMGLPHTPAEHIRLEDNKLLREQHGFKFICLGNSLYELPGEHKGSRGSTSGSQVGTLPYCEGVEVVVSSADAVAPAAGSSGQQQAPEEWSTVLASFLGGEESPVARGVARFGKTAMRNWDRMKATASQAYTVTLKPLIDKLSGDQ